MNLRKGKSYLLLQKADFTAGAQEVGSIDCKKAGGTAGEGKCCGLTVMAVYGTVLFVKMQPIVLLKCMYHVVHKLYLNKAHL